MAIRLIEVKDAVNPRADLLQAGRAGELLRLRAARSYLGTWAAPSSGIWGEFDSQIPWKGMPWAPWKLSVLINHCCGSNKSAGGKQFIWSSSRHSFSVLFLSVCSSDKGEKDDKGEREGRCRAKKSIRICRGEKLLKSAKRSS